MPAPRPELARAVYALSGEKGPGSISLGSEVLPTVVVDNPGPYPGCRLWMAGRNVPGVAANYSYAGIVNNDPASVRSVVVIDQVHLRFAAADDVYFRLSLAAVTTLSTLTPVQDVAEEKDQLPTDSPLLGNVLVGGANFGVSAGGILVPCGTTIRHYFNTQITLGPGAQFQVQSGIVNNALIVAFFGRYYPGV